jgi:hypothetical protein
MHECGQVAHHDAADLDCAQLDARGASDAVRGVHLNRIVARYRANAEARGVALTQRDVRRAGVDDELQPPAIHPGFDLEMAVVGAIDAHAAIVVGHLSRRSRHGCSRRRAAALVDKLDRQHAGDQQREGEGDDLSHDPPQ